MTGNTEVANTEEPAASAEPAKFPTSWYINLYDHPTLKPETLAQAQARRLTGIAHGITVAIIVNEHNRIMDVQMVEEF